MSWFKTTTESLGSNDKAVKFLTAFETDCNSSLEQARQLRIYLSRMNDRIHEIQDKSATTIYIDSRLSAFQKPFLRHIKTYKELVVSLGHTYMHEVQCRSAAFGLFVVKFYLGVCEIRDQMVQGKKCATDLELVIESYEAWDQYSVWLTCLAQLKPIVPEWAKEWFGWMPTVFYPADAVEIEPFIAQLKIFLHENRVKGFTIKSGEKQFVTLLYHRDKDVRHDKMFLRKNFELPESVFCTK